MRKEARYPKHPNKLRALIREAGLNIREVHRETKIPESTLYYWAAGNGIIPKEDRLILARVIGCTTHELVPQYAMVESLRGSDFSALGGEMIIKRRKLLQLLNITGSALFILDIDWDHLETSLTKPSHMDTAVVNDLEAINNHYWNLFMIAASKSSVLDGVLGQLKMQIQFLTEPQEARTHQRLCSLTSNMGQLAGEIFFDLHDHTTAQSCYAFAATVAREAKAYDLWAGAVVRHSYLPIFDERHEDALSLLKQAENIAQRGDPALPTKYWAAATYAEAESGVGNLKACQSALERAHGVHDIKGTSPAWTRFDGSRLPALQGACYVRLGQPHLAEPVLQEALQQRTKSDRRRAMILSDLALSALQQTHIEKACAYAQEVLTIVSHTSSGFLRNNLLKIQQQLVPFADVEEVKTLKNSIASLG
ncbi:MAG: helix-turn-helix transcriptional regulator [Ktedonobacteraceae bacterium]